MDCASYRDQMLDVLYGEADAESARRVEEHQGTCETCREEMWSLRQVRRDLKAWTLPAAAATPVAPQPLAARAPRYLALAAGLVMAAGAALGFSGSELSYREGRLAFRFGRASAAPQLAAIKPTDTSGLEADLAALKATLARLEAKQVVLANAVAAGMDAEGIRRVVQEAEARMEASYKRELVDFRTDVADQLQLQNTVVGARFAVVEAGAQIRDVRMANNRLVPVSQEK